MHECPGCGQRWLAWDVARRLDGMLDACWRETSRRRPGTTTKPTFRQPDHRHHAAADYPPNSQAGHGWLLAIPAPWRSATDNSSQSMTTKSSCVTHGLVVDSDADHPAGFGVDLRQDGEPCSRRKWSCDPPYVTWSRARFSRGSLRHASDRPVTAKTD